MHQARGRARECGVVEIGGDTLAGGVIMAARLFRGDGGVWVEVGLTQHEISRELVGPGCVVVQGGQFKLQHLQSFYCVARVEVLQVFLLQ